MGRRLQWHEDARHRSAVSARTELSCLLRSNDALYGIQQAAAGMELSLHAC